MAHVSGRLRDALKTNNQTARRVKGTRQMQGDIRRFSGAKTPGRYWFAERVWNFGVNLAAALVAILIAVPFLWVIFKFWQMTLTRLGG